MKYPKFLQMLTLAAVVTSAVPLVNEPVYASGKKEMPGEYEARTEYSLPKGYHYVLSDGKYVVFDDNGKVRIEKDKSKEAAPKSKEPEQKKASVPDSEEASEKTEEKKTSGKESAKNDTSKNSQSDRDDRKITTTEDKETKENAEKTSGESGEEQSGNQSEAGSVEESPGGQTGEPEEEQPDSRPDDEPGSVEEPSGESEEEQSGDRPGSGEQDSDIPAGDVHEPGSVEETPEGSGEEQPGDGPGSGEQDSDIPAGDVHEPGSVEKSPGGQTGESGSQPEAGSEARDPDITAGDVHKPGETDVETVNRGPAAVEGQNKVIDFDSDGKRDGKKKLIYKLESRQTKKKFDLDFEASKPFTAIKNRICYNVEVPMEGIPSFITQEMVVGALKAQDETGYPASVTIAQIINESGYGKFGPGGEDGQGLSYLAYQYCNLFGIKGTGTAGSAVMNTKEMTSGGVTYSTQAGFRAYHTYTECIEDRSELLKNVYSDLTENVTDANTFAINIGRRWATSIYYGQGLIKTMETYDLYRLDEMTLIDFSKMIGTFANPCPGSRITSGFGYRSFDDKFHKGLDMGTGSQNIPTYAAEAGRVTYAGSADAAGNLIIINHGNGLVTKYMHHSQIYVKLGQQVEKGQQIGLSGTTGRSTGNHLHFQVEQDGAAMNPMIYLTNER